MESGYSKVPVYPLARYLAPGDREVIPCAKVPSAFAYDGDTVTVDEILACEQGVSRKVGGRGYRFTCRVSWVPGGVLRSQRSVVWYDDFLDEWFLEVPKGRAPREMGYDFLPEISLPGRVSASPSADILFAGRYVKRPIYPLVRYLRPEEKKGIPVNKVYPKLLPA